MRAVDSPKKWTDEFDLFAVKSKKANKTNSFVRFLGESTTRKSAYSFIWPLEKYGRAKARIFWFESQKSKTQMTQQDRLLPALPTRLCWRQSPGFAWCEWTILPSVLIISCLGCCISHSNMQDLLSMFVQDNSPRLYLRMNRTKKTIFALHLSMKFSQ